MVILKNFNANDFQGFELFKDVNMIFYVLMVQYFKLLVHSLLKGYKHQYQLKRVNVDILVNTFYDFNCYQKINFLNWLFLFF